MDENCTFDNNDTLNRKILAERLTEVLTTFSPFYEEAYVLGLNASYGSGKTAFLKMWKNYLEQFDAPYNVIYINAWETDFDEEPLIPIISSFIQALEVDNQTSDKIKSSLKGVLGAFANVGNSMIAQTTGVNISETLDNIHEELTDENLEARGNKLYKNYSFKKDVYDQLKIELENYVAGLDKPLMVFVDELDRVRPNYAVEFLEAIKHIFSISGICFVVAVDRDQIESSVRQLYGDIDFKNYYLRFITREAYLPEAFDGNYSAFIDKQAELFFHQKSEKEINFAFPNQYIDGIKRYVSDMAKIFRLTPRQVKNLFRSFAQITAISKEDRFSQMPFIYDSVTLLALSIANEELYKKLAYDNKVKGNELRNYLLSLNYAAQGYGLSSDEFIFNTFTCCANSNNSEDFAQTLSVLFHPTLKGDERLEDIKGQRHRMARQINHFDRFETTSNFQHLYKIIEEWKEFIQ